LAEQIRDLPALGVSAQSWHFLNHLIAYPIKAAVLDRSGVLVQIPPAGTLCHPQADRG
jgi:hypothetical protein